MTFVNFKQPHFLLFRPRFLADVGVQVVVPPLTTLLSCSFRFIGCFAAFPEKAGNLRPIFAPSYFYSTFEGLIFLLQGKAT